MNLKLKLPVPANHELKHVRYLFYNLCQFYIFYIVIFQLIFSLFFSNFFNKELINEYVSRVSCYNFSFSFVNKIFDSI